MFELEQIIPGIDPADLDIDTDPILEAADLAAAGAPAQARTVLMNLLAQDLRCLDAHAHLGNLELDHHPAKALRHYEMGASIGALSLGKTFNDVLPWSLIDNRPFLRCLHGLATCCWRVGKLDEATVVFRKMLWLNPATTTKAPASTSPRSRQVARGRPARSS